MSKTEKLKKLKTFDEMWDKELKSYLSCNRGLDEGYADGKYTKVFAKYCKNVVGIDLSEDFYKKAKENLKDCKNVELKIMDARKTTFKDKSFDVVLNTSFHEFDLVPGVFSIDKKLKTEMLEEMARLSDTIVFAEIDPDLNISGELFQLFSPVEDHCKRVKLSNKIIDKIMPKLGYKRVKLGKAVDLIKYNSEKEFCEDMLEWWSDVRVPKTKEERDELLSNIEKVLTKHGYLQDLCFYDVFRYCVYQKVK